MGLELAKKKTTVVGSFDELASKGEQLHSAIVTDESV